MLLAMRGASIEYRPDTKSFQVFILMAVVDMLCFQSRFQGGDRVGTLRYPCVAIHDVQEREGAKKSVTIVLIDAIHAHEIIIYLNPSQPIPSHPMIPSAPKLEVGSWRKYDRIGWDG